MDRSNFQAASAVHSNIETAYLQMTGIFSSTFHHEVPFKFPDIRCGERYDFLVDVGSSIKAKIAVIIKLRYQNLSLAAVPGHLVS